MAKTAKAGKKTGKAKQPAIHLAEELEGQFHIIQKKIGKARNDYIDSHQKELAAARNKMKSVQAKVTKARTKTAKAAVRAKNTGTRAAGNQLKKARAASLLLGESLKETKDILVTAQSKLHSAKPFDRKLAARAKVLAQFEKDWDKKLKAEAVTRAKGAKKAAAKRRSTAKKRAVKRQATS
ncbi:MAG: hypothetical protein JKY98_11600 [Gammaproteobacteria bacterium]|nr:hypothetical protein [Gammaproteobacteria bacterium]